jgi:selenocysteine lyase/cysteine desulfurase
LFGIIVRPVRDAFRHFQDQVEQCPDAHFRYEYPPLLNDARASIAALLSVVDKEVVFVPNAITAMNTVFRNLVFSKGDVIIFLCYDLEDITRTAGFDLSEQSQCSAISLQAHSGES